MRTYEIIEFFPRVLQKYQKWYFYLCYLGNLIKIPGLEYQIALAEKDINENLEKFKEDI